MSEPQKTLSETKKPQSAAASAIPEGPAVEIRKLAHELANSLEVIVQTTYLLGMAELKEPASDWLKMLDQAVTKALDVNVHLREFIKKNTQS